MVEKSKPTAAAERLQSLSKRPGNRGKAAFIRHYYFMTKQLSLIKGFISRHDSVECFNTMLLGASLSCSVHF